MHWCSKPSRWVLGVGAAHLATIFLSTAVLLTFKLGNSSMSLMEIAASFGVLAVVHGIAGLRCHRGDQPRQPLWPTHVGIALLQLAGLGATLIGLKCVYSASWILMMNTDAVIIFPLTTSFLNVNYRFWHYSGFACAGFGLIALSLFDGAVAPSGCSVQDCVSNGILVGIGALVLGIANVWMECELRKGASRHELLTGVGGFGAIFGFAASLLAQEVRTHSIQEFTMDVVFLRLGVALTLFLLHGVLSVSLPYAGAVHQKTWFFAASLCVQGGLLLFGGGGFAVFLNDSLPGIVFGGFLLLAGGLVYLLGGDPYAIVEKTGEPDDESAAPLLV